MDEFEISNIINIDETIAKEIFENCRYAWEVLPKIHDFIIDLGKKLDKEKFEQIGENIWVAKSASIASTAYIGGPCIIDENAEIRHCAYIRENAIVGKNVVVRKFNRIKKCNFV